jgi:mRNA-degrading endonuclease RelE of RelBE toxin-antitoxin system
MFSISYASDRIRKRLNDELHIPRDQALKIKTKIESELSNFNPKQRSKDVKKLQDSSRWRLRMGDYRVIFIPDFKSHTIQIVSISQRGNAYD